MAKPINLITSPATPAALLLYGIVFGFAMWSYLGSPWPQHFTITFYIVVSIWSAIVLYSRWAALGFSVNRLDVLFCTFLLWVLGSVATHWWSGTIKYLEFMPFFFILPYLLGRMMLTHDLDLFKKILISAAGALLLLLPFEYIKNSQPGFLYENSPAPILFGQGHGTMLSGLIFSAALLALISKLLHPITSSAERDKYRKTDHIFYYLLLAAIISAMVWIASRGPAVAAGLGAIVLFFFSSSFAWRKKMTILFYLGVFALVASTISFQNKHHKEYFQLLFLKPSVALSQVPINSPRLEYGKPILGGGICKEIPNSIADRWIHYRSAWEIFLAKPLVGVGANSYGFYSCAGPGWYPHSTILQVLAELGILGGLIYFPLLLVVVSVPIKRYLATTDMPLKENMSWLLAYMALQITISQFNGNFFMSASLYFTIGIAASFYDGAKSKQVES